MASSKKVPRDSNGVQKGIPVQRTMPKIQPKPKPVRVKTV